VSEEPGLPQGWAWTTLDPILASIEAGKSFRCDERPPGPDEIGVVKVSAVTWGTYNEQESKTIKESGRFDAGLLVQPGDFLFSRANTIELVGACVIAHYVTRQVMLSDKILRLRFAEVFPEFILWALRSRQGRDEIERLATGNQESMRNIAQENIRRIHIPLPPLSEQRRIVAAIEQQFTRLDAGVAVLKRAQAALTRYRAAVLKAAVEGRLTEAWREEHPDVKPASALLARILAERRARWESDLRSRGKDLAKARYEEPKEPNTTGLPALPEGWYWATVEQLAAAEPNSITDGPFGSNLKTEHYTSSGIRVIRLQNVGDGVFRDEKAYITQEHFGTLNKHEVFAGDLVIAALGENPPRSCILPEFVGPAIVKADCIRFKPSPHVNAAYLNAVLNAEPTRNRTVALLHGVGRPRLNLSEIKSIVVPLPPATEQEQIVAEVERRLSVVGVLESAVEANLKRAERLRQGILREAFAGQLVPHDPDDEPASALLERIRRERAPAVQRREHEDTGHHRSRTADSVAKTILAPARALSLWDS
jgi:type I restriction enzyme, S subunit